MILETAAKKASQPAKLPPHRNLRSLYRGNHPHVRRARRVSRCRVPISTLRLGAVQAFP